MLDLFASWPPAAAAALVAAIVSLTTSVLTHPSGTAWTGRCTEERFAQSTARSD
jgi:hypothetical protein